MITITSIKIETSPSYEPELHFEGVLRLNEAERLNLTDDEYALLIGQEFIKHVVFVTRLTKD